MSQVQTMVDQLSKLKVLEIVELVKELEKEWGVSAAAPVAAAVAAAPVEAVEEQTEFTVTLVSAGPNKINVIKEVRALLNLGLTEAKALSESSMAVLKEGVKKDEAEAIKAKLVAVGATVEIK